MKIGFITFGCEKNVIDTEVIMGTLAKEGYYIAHPSVADSFFINTCAFIKDAIMESTFAIEEMEKEKKKGNLKALFVCGCLVERFKKKVLGMFPHVDIFFGTDVIDEIPSILKDWENGRAKRIYLSKRRYIYDENTPRISTYPTHIGFVKVAEGCSRRCTFCTIPKIRGGFRTRTVESVFREVKNLVTLGAKEIVLVAQDLSSFGKGRGENLLDLLKRLSDIRELEWIRCLYCYPCNLLKEVAKITKETKVCSYLDIPIQHIDDKVLKSMGRGDEKSLKSLVYDIKSLCPEVTLRTTVMVGFPSEDDGSFKKLYDFLSERFFDYFVVFLYSPEVGTKAYLMEDKTPMEVKEERYRALLRLQREICKKSNEKLLGKIKRAVVEEKLSGKKRDIYRGRIETQAPYIDGYTYIEGKDLSKGQFIDVEIERSTIYDFKARCIKVGGVL